MSISKINTQFREPGFPHTDHHARSTFLTIDMLAEAHKADGYQTHARYLKALYEAGLLTLIDEDKLLRQAREIAAISPKMKSVLDMDHDKVFIPTMKDRLRVLGHMIEQHRGASPENIRALMAQWEAHAVGSLLPNVQEVPVHDPHLPAILDEKALGEASQSEALFIKPLAEGETAPNWATVHQSEFTDEAGTVRTGRFYVNAPAFDPLLRLILGELLTDNYRVCARGNPHLVIPHFITDDVMRYPDILTRQMDDRRMPFEYGRNSTRFHPLNAFLSWVTKNVDVYEYVKQKGFPSIGTHLRRYRVPETGIVGGTIMSENIAARRFLVQAKPERIDFNFFIELAKGQIERDHALVQDGLRAVTAQHPLIFQSLPGGVRAHAVKALRDVIRVHENMSASLPAKDLEQQLSGNPAINKDSVSYRKKLLADIAQNDSSRSWSLQVWQMAGLLTYGAAYAAAPPAPEVAPGVA